VTQDRRVLPAVWVVEPLIARIDQMLEHGGHILRIDKPGQAERCRAGAVPAAGRLSRRDRTGVVIYSAGATSTKVRVSGGGVR
jgi:hypothetical protein